MVAIKHTAPAFAEQDALTVAALFGIRGNVRSLPGEHDRNFHLVAADDHEYVLKISHAGEERAILDLQNAALAHLAVQAPELALPRVSLALSGESITTVTGPNGAQHFARLLTYVPGKLLADTRPHSRELLSSLGSVLGALDRALAGFDHPAAVRDLKWDLPRAGWIRDYLVHIPDPARYSVVERLLDHFEAETLPRLSPLPHSVIYNDANDYNVLVGGPPDARRVVGVVDFGDLLRSATICELAIACAYAMMGKPDPLAAAAQIVAGYHSAAPLSEDELAVLYGLICARLCVSVANSAYQRAIDPDNTYLQISDAPAWELLERLVSVHPQQAHYLFRAACGLPACPTTSAVIMWLRGQRGEFASLVQPQLTAANTLTYDLSIASRELGANADFADTGAFTRTLFERLREEGAIAGIGRYNEARPIYTTDAFRIEGNDGPDWRTVHTALDIFMAAGTPIYAPLEGIVHSFGDNAAPLDYGPTIILEHRAGLNGPTFYTLYGHLSRDSLTGLSQGRPIAHGQEIARIGDTEVNGGWPPHLHFQIVIDLLGKRGEFPGVARPSERALWLGLSPDPNLIVSLPFDCDAGSSAAATEDILAARRKLIGGNLSVSYRQPLQIVRGYLQYLYDADGRRYLDAVNNVPHVGHSHQRVVRAGQRQMAVLNTNTRYLHEDLVYYAERLTATLPEPLRVCYFVCSGSEANELALRLARAHTRRKRIIVVDVAYHGNTTTLVDISPYKHNGPGGLGPPAWVTTIPMPDTYRGPYTRDDAEAGVKYAHFVAEAINAMRGHSEQPAAFICESMLGCGGQLILPDGYLAAAYTHARASGAVCIADEVQAGFGRVGSHFWAFETQGVVPDIVTLGKPIGNGHPLGAVVTTPEIAASFDNGMEYFNTFGGNPVSSAIGLAVLDVLRDEGLQANALAVGMYLLSGLQSLMDRHCLIGEARGLGLFLGVELVRDRVTKEPAPDQASYITNRMRERGILISADGPHHNVLKIKPPLVFTASDADFLLTTLDGVLAEDGAQL